MRAGERDLDYFNVAEVQQIHAVIVIGDKALVCVHSLVFRIAYVRTHASIA